MEFQKRNDPVPSGIFELRLRLNERRVTIILEFDFENGRIYYKTTRGLGQVEGFDPPLEFRRFMTPDFVKFYVFDGELADNILSRDHTDAETAVENLFQVHLLRRMVSKISEYWDEQTQNLSATDQTGYTRRTRSLEKWRSRLGELVRQRETDKTKLEQVLNDLNRQRERYDTEIKKEEERAKQLGFAEEKFAKFENRVRETAQGILDSMRDPHAISSEFATSMYDFKTGLDRVKLPESAAREFFEELAEEDQCVCGRPINHEIKEEIKTRAAQYLGSDDVSLLNNMKSAIEESVGASQTQACEILSGDTETLGTLMGEKLKARNELDELQQDAERSDPQVKHAREEIDRLSEEKIRLEGKLSRFEGPDETVRLDRIGSVDPTRIFSIKTIQDGIAILEDQVSEITGTLTLRRKRDLLCKIIRKAYGSARDRITTEITDQANERIADLMPDNQVRVEKIDRCILLKGQSSGSAGENLSIGYAFLATLFNRSGEHQLPFVVDSPANPIDYDTRPKIGELAPVLTDQFIGFVISSERERFLPALRQTANREIKYITLFRKSITRHAERARKCSGSITTDDGIQVADEQFFTEFQLDLDEEL